MVCINILIKTLGIFSSRNFRKVWWTKGRLKSKQKYDLKNLIIWGWWTLYQILIVAIKVSMTCY